MAGRHATEVAAGRPKTGVDAAYTIPGVEIFDVGGFTMTANRANYMPFVVDAVMSIDQLVIEVTTAVAATTVRTGIYTADANDQPVALVVDSGDLDSATVGVKTAAVAVTLQPGRYVFWTNSNGGPGLRSWTTKRWISPAIGNAFLWQLYVPQTYGPPPVTPLAWNTFATSGAFNYVTVLRQAT